MFYPFQHVGVRGESFQHLLRRTQLYLFMAQLHELVIVDCAAHVQVDLGKLLYIFSQKKFEPGMIKIFFLNLFNCICGTIFDTYTAVRTLT